MFKQHVTGNHKNNHHLGFKMLRPPYHCNYDSVELVWPNLKRYLTTRSNLLTSDVEDLFMDPVNCLL